MYGIQSNVEVNIISTFAKQLVFATIGLVLFVVFTFVNYRTLQNYAYFLYGAGALLLIAVLIFGTTIRGTTGWFQLAGFSIQPVEFVKLILVIALARFFSDHVYGFTSWKTIGYAFSLVSIYGLLVMKQPDLGSTAIFIAAFIVLLWLTNIKPKQLLIIAGSGLFILLLAWTTILQPYQKDRILTFLNPSRDPLDSGYNVTQSIISVGSGKLVGRGLGLGTQSQLHFLPERESDFIFAVIAEELGFIGATIVVVLLGVILFRLWLLMRITDDDFSKYLITGIALLIFFQSLINVGMNIGILPVTGIPLPLVSAGGSSLFATLIALGITQNCRMQLGSNKAKLAKK